jgi:hypothetical protein
MEKGKFEGSVSDAFKNAEVSPSENSWNNIALELEKANGQQLKKRVLFYQMLAAASVVFALGVSFGMFLMTSENADLTEQLAVQQSINNSHESEKQSAIHIAESNDNAVAEEEVTEKNQNGERKSANQIAERTENSIVRKSVTGNDRSFRTAGNESYEKQNALVTQADNNNNQIIQNQQDKDGLILLANNSYRLPELYHIGQPQLLYVKKEQEADPVALMMARLNDREKEIVEEDKKEKEKRSETLWTSVGFAAGTFSCSTSSGASATKTANYVLATNNDIADKEATASGVAYSMGVSLGKKLSERWVLQGGVNYLTQSSDYTAHNAVSSPDFTSFRPASIHELAKMNVSADANTSNEEKLVATAPYNVNNSIRYLSIPLQAGYIIVNHAFGVQVNAGIATDVFLQSTVTAEGKDISKSEQESGEDSPYRPVNLSGLMGTELSYKFAKNYRIALNPGIRYSLNTIYKSDLGVDTAPITFDLGLRFRYIFN